MNRMIRSHLALAAFALAMPVFAMADEGGGGAAAAAPVTETKTVIKQNGIKRPDAGSVTGKLWDIADEISNQLGKPAPRKDVVDRYMLEVPNANQATANTQYARWVTFHGVSGILRDARAAETAERRAAADAAKVEAKEKADAAKAAETAAAEAAKAEKVAAAEAAKQAKEAEKQRKAEEREAKKTEAAAEKQRKADEKAAAAAAAAEAAKNKPAA